MLNIKSKTYMYLNITINILAIFYLISLIYFILFGKPYQIAPCLSSLGVTLFIKILLKKSISLFSPILIFAIVIYTLFSAYLGSSFDFYGIIHNYDDIMHFLSGVLSTLFAYDLYFIFNSRIPNYYTNRYFIIIFVFCFSLAIGGLWEIAEFTIDNLFKTNMQVGGLIDTMIDMIDSLAASIITISIYELVNKNIK
ncbi:hypothetical protein [Paraclostridium sordellii]|uniref:hypothetical protein n=1 Tax=Paraclostridium sordellii TaxID=1505 RepID=UPI000386E816|nr:hypothetical protein [Paeniclostridium sordellii]EPZ56824.1 hypothetical protein H476_2304 [[Clostridium] sordellii VPI 9048] [Paeniclostridium sordellii VPI 9048]MBX9181624.1 hypothetical protein [Paeniclostridium sordellii]CEK38547.1 putative membrane protein [[Clostridium] sordellii] [Paeniclostridium sordellii]CEO14874.1 membrane protein [[Clostridium] sordellii] [Paeniclostridium sordellii]CEP83250.1 membrane protein [[Clostridium] sordellii] [Paeniclostridium sordellii]